MTLLLAPSRAIFQRDIWLLATVYSILPDQGAVSIMHRPIHIHPLASAQNIYVSERQNRKDSARVSLFLSCQLHDINNYPILCSHALLNLEKQLLSSLSSHLSHLSHLIALSLPSLCIRFFLNM